MANSLEDQIQNYYKNWRKEAEWILSEKSAKFLQFGNKIQIRFDKVDNEFSLQRDSCWNPSAQEKKEKWKLKVDSNSSTFKSQVRY